MEADIVEEPMKKVTCNEIVEGMQKMKSGKATGPKTFEVKGR